MVAKDFILQMATQEGQQQSHMSVPKTNPLILIPNPTASFAENCMNDIYCIRSHEHMARWMIMYDHVISTLPGTVRCNVWLLPLVCTISLYLYGYLWNK